MTGVTTDGVTVSGDGAYTDRQGPLRRWGGARWTTTRLDCLTDGVGEHRTYRGSG